MSTRSWHGVVAVVVKMYGGKQAGENQSRWWRGEKYGGEYL